MTGIPPMSSRWAPSATPVVTSLPSGVHAGTPVRISTHSGSVSVRSRVADPSAGSNAYTSIRRWSRGITAISGGPPADQCAATRYSQSVCDTSTRLPSSPTNDSDTSALAVPAAG